MENLASTWHAQGKLEEALLLLEDAVILYGKVLGPAHPETVSAIEKLELWKELPVGDEDNNQTLDLLDMYLDE